MQYRILNDLPTQACRRAPFAHALVKPHMRAAASSEIAGHKLSSVILAIFPEAGVVYKPAQ
jgi:hypothetical protein